MLQDPRRRLRVSLLLLLPIVVATVLLMARVQFRGAISVDNRTYVEMTTGVQAHGLPYTLNAYSEDFPEARPPFNVPRDGKLWGEYTPLYPYLGAVALRLGGLAALSKQSVLLIGLLGLAVFGLGTRFSGDPLRGVAAAYLTLLGSPVWASSLQTLSLPLLFLLFTLAAWAALASLDAKAWRAGALAGAAGLLAGLSVATHLLGMSMALMLIVGLAYATTETPAAASWRQKLWPDAAGGRRAALAGLGLLFPLAPMGWLNHQRFGTYNPISYGPCVWAQCSYNVQDSLNPGGLLAFVAPAVPYFALVAVGVHLTRKRPWALFGVLVVAALALVPATPFGTPAFRILRAAYGYVFDTSPLDFGHVASYGAFDPDLGHGRAGQVVKSFLQSSPVLLCALLVPFGRSGRSGRALLLLLPVVGLFGNLALFGRFDGAWAMGHPLVFLRYTIPAAPLLAVLAVEALWQMRWRREHAVLVAVLSVVGIGYFASDVRDWSLFRRIVELRVTLLVSVLTVLVAVLVRRRASRLWTESLAALAALGLALSFTISLGVDTRMLWNWGRELDVQVERFAALTPQRFALVGYGPVSDHVLTLRAERDIVYFDLIESPGLTWENFRTVIDLWTDDGLPIYAVFPTDVEPPFKWPYADWDVPAELLDAKLGFWKVGPPAPARRLPPAQIDALRRQLRAAWEDRKARGEVL